MHKIISIILLLVYIITNPVIGEERMRTVKPVSMYQLLATPEKYDGELILVVGYTLVTDRTASIFPHGIDYEHNIHYNALSLGLDREEREKYYKNHKQYSIIVGTFNAKRKMGNLVNYGTIEKITRFDVWDYSYDSSYSGPFKRVGKIPKD